MDKIYEVSLIGVHTFWVESGEDIKQKVVVFEEDRGKYGFPRLNSRQQKEVINKFINMTGVKMKYRTVYDFELKKRERSPVWLHRRLQDLGLDYQYNSVARWVSGYYQPETVAQEAMNSIFLQC